MIKDKNATAAPRDRIIIVESRFEELKRRAAAK
jgi:hypothetical protein